MGGQQLTVGKLDAGMAVLLTSDHHQIEFPSILLPKAVTAGSIINITVCQDHQAEKEEIEKFNLLQAQILQKYGSTSPSPPVLRLRNATQTSIVLEWDPLELASCTFKDLSLWKNGHRLGKIPDPMNQTVTKLSGLQLDTIYSFHLVLSTTGGTFSSPPLTVHTHKMTDLSGITICKGELPESEEKRLQAAVINIGARLPIQETVQIDTTHFVCAVGRGEEWKKAEQKSIPSVTVDWIEACAQEGRIVGVKGYYLGADPALRRQSVGPTSQSYNSKKRSSQTSLSLSSATKEEPTSPLSRTVHPYQQAPIYEEPAEPSKQSPYAEQNNSEITKSENSEVSLPEETSPEGRTIETAQEDSSICKLPSPTETGEDGGNDLFETVTI
ncbi:Chitin biosynthesis protein CHS5 [Neolecta irregularis DAH-3]|uniref:Chitin biosynthesis protein CHS5 n=1 Tax=Neolecta irregularis (strain DAH-3) TaxID=1198029 RepID=A0A1U7LUX6_NEOID|nr:Chitin biosynthesis protein CHS5 [Neolecta irregularis DAH-3]|eukprot:OLL26476.1 Chitin biosynthesis protein CHS5 [Neolecta irregularis DAH-3]